jgi:acetylornithine deacetylase/succinyl-diaminopimelate desuccinylase-like protein
MAPAQKKVPGTFLRPGRRRERPLRPPRRPEKVPGTFFGAFLGAFLMAAAGAALSAQPNLRTQIDAYVRANQKAIVTELVTLLKIPNVAADKENIRKNATLLREMLARRGFTAELLETNGNPLVWGELRTPGVTRTLLLYAHYDGQPVNPKDWRQASPFTPLLRDGRMEDGAQDLGDPLARQSYEPRERIYARSASDDKSPIVALLAAFDALKAVGARPTSNIRVILDGEEEAGSPNIVPAISKYRDKLTADAMFIFDGPVHPSERPTIVYGARGTLPVQLTVYGPKFPLHSGHYGNWVPNPAMRLAELLATMKDDNGKVTIAGFYDGIPPFSAEERAILDGVPDDAGALQKLFGIAGPEVPGLKLQEALQYPSLNIRGLSSAFVGGDARTIIPATAIAEIDIRLVKETPAGRMRDLLLAHIRKQGWHVVTSEPDDATRAKFSRIVKVETSGEGTNAYRTSPLLPISKQVVAAMTNMFGEPPVQIRTSGGTVPIVHFIDALGFPAMSVTVVNFDNNQHGENENLRLGHFFRAIPTLAAVLTM